MPTICLACHASLTKAIECDADYNLSRCVAKIINKPLVFVVSSSVKIILLQNILNKLKEQFEITILSSKANK